MPEDAEICREEIFGPVAVVNKFKTEEEVLRKANDSEYGLSAAVFTQDINRAMRIASEIESGTVCVNNSVQNIVSVPFGGSKQSGLGREGAINALREYTEPKTVFINLQY